MFYSAISHLLIQYSSMSVYLSWHVLACLFIVLARDGSTLRKVVVLHRSDAPLFMWCECWMLLWLLQNLSGKDYGLLKNEICWFDIHFVDNLGFIDPDMLSSVHLIWIKWFSSRDNAWNGWLKIFTKLYSFCYQWLMNPRSRSDWDWPGRTSYRGAATRAGKWWKTCLFTTTNGNGN